MFPLVIKLLLGWVVCVYKTTEQNFEIFIAALVIFKEGPRLWIMGNSPETWIIIAVFFATPLLSVKVFSE